MHQYRNIDALLGRQSIFVDVYGNNNTDPGNPLIQKWKDSIWYSCG
jgi:hypothetical protein